MRRQILKLECCGTWRIIHDDSKRYNPYIVYHDTWKDGWHRKKVADFCDLANAILYIADVLRPPMPPRR